MSYLDTLASALSLKNGVEPANQFVIDEHVSIMFESHEDERDFELIVTIQKGKTQLLDVIEIPDGDLDLMQFLCLSPVCCKESHVADLVRAVHLINKVSPLPGFGYDEVDRRPFFRFALPVTETTCSPEMLKNAVYATEQIIDLYLPALEGIALGKIEFDALVERSSQDLADDIKRLHR